MIEVFGWTAAAIGLAVGIPQLIRILRSGTSAGVSLRLWQLNAATTVSWAVHGVLTDTPQMQVPNLIGAVVAVGIVLFVCRDRRQPFLVQLVLPLLVVAMVMHLAKTVALLHAVMLMAMAASLALGITALVVALLLGVTWVLPVVATAVTLLHASPLLQSLRAASRLHPTMHASVPHAPRVDFV